MHNDISQVLADNEVIKKSAQFVIDVEKYHGKLPQNHVRYGESLKIPLLQIVAGNRLQSLHAKKRLEALNAAIEYAQTDDKSARKRYGVAFKQADRIALQLAKG